MNKNDEIPDNDEDVLSQIGEELRSLSKDDEDVFESIANTDAMDVIKPYKPMVEVGTIEVIEKDGKRFLKEVNDELGLVIEHETMAITAAIYPVGTQFIIYEPTNEKRTT